MAGTSTTTTATSKPAAKPPADPPKEGGDKKKDGVWSEMFASVGLLAIGAFTSVAAVVQTGGVDAVEAAILNFMEDIAFERRHRWVIRARRVVWFWAFWPWVTFVTLVYARFATGLNLFTFGSFLTFLLGTAGTIGVQVYARRVEDGTFLEHRQARYPLDEARKELRGLEALRKRAIEDAAYRAPANLGDRIRDAEEAVADEQNTYNQFIHDHGANDRNPGTVLGLGWLCAVLMGFALLYGVIGSHDGGPYSFEEVQPFVIGVCMLPAPIALLPMAIVMFFAPFVFTQVGKVEDALTLVRRSVKAAVDTSKNLTEVVHEEILAKIDNGDDPHRNSSQINLQHFMMSMSLLMWKIISASLLFMHHALYFPNTAAFAWSIGFGFALFALDSYLRKHNVYTEKGPWIVGVLGILGMVAIYGHYFAAGGAPPGYRGISWWWSEYGPFASQAAHAVSRATTNAATRVGEAVAPTATTYSTAIGHTTIESFFKVLAIIVVVVGAALLAFRYGSLLLKKTEDVWMKRFALLIAAPAAAVLIVLGLALVLKAPVDTTRTDTQSTPHSVTTEAGNLGSQARRSVGLGLGEGAQALDEANDQREADLDRRAWCQLDGAGHTRCTEQCFQLHGKDPQTVPDERSAGNCYDRQQ